MSAGKIQADSSNYSGTLLGGIHCTIVYKADHIHDYLLGCLSRADEIAFEASLMTDPTLVAKVKWMRSQESHTEDAPPEMPGEWWSILERMRT
jgi:hypothetical protein